MFQLGRHVFRVMDEYTNYNYKIGTNTYVIQTVYFIIIKGCVNHDIITLLYNRHLFVKMPFSIISFR